MQILTMPQGSPEWDEARLGYATSSEFHSVLAKGEGKKRNTYLRKVVAERLTGQSLESYQNENMLRGKLLEDDARAAYSRHKGVEVELVGLIRHDTLKASCSPDGLVYWDGGIEIKSVIPTTQIDTFQLEGRYPTEHKPQIQGNLWLSEREWWDFVSYCPTMPQNLQLYITRIYRDPAYIGILKDEVERFLEDVELLEQKLRHAA
jgi:hypothetical protein